MTDSKPLPRFTREERWLLFTLAAIQFTHIVDFMVIMPLGPQLMRLFEIGPQRFGFVVSSYNLAAGLAGILGAFFTDRFDRKRILQVNYAGFILGTIACAFAPSYEFLLAARALTGAFGGVMGAQIMAVVGDVISPARRATATATVMTAFSVASIFGVPFGLSLANAFSWHAPFVFLAALSALVLAFLSRTMPPVNAHLAEGVPKMSDTFQTLANVARDVNSRWALGLMSLLMFGQFMVIPFISPYLVSNTGFPESNLPLVYFFGGGCTIISATLIGRLADRVGRARVFTIFGTLFLIPIFLITHLPPLPVPAVLLVACLFFILTNGRFIPAMTLVTSSISPKTRGSFMSVQSSVQSMSAGLASLVSGLIVTRAADGTLQNYNWVGYLAMVIAIASVPVARRIAERS